MKKKAMFSQPLAGKTPEEITATREKTINYLHDMGYEIENLEFDNKFYSKEEMDKRGVVNPALCYLAKSLEQMTKCDTVYFCLGWEKARGCILEHKVALAYNLNIIYEVEL